jgi:hypothetical protein
MFLVAEEVESVGIGWSWTFKAAPKRSKCLVGDLSPGNLINHRNSDISDGSKITKKLLL